MTTLRSVLSKPNQNTTVDDDLKWELALEYSGIGMWEFDAVLNRVYFSEGSKKILGVSDPLFGNDPNAWNIRVHPDDKEKYFQDFKDHLTGLKAMYENEHRVKCEDDSYKWIRDRGKVIEWASPSVPRRVVGTHTDITAQKQQEQAVNDALIIASEHNNKLKNFAHIVTH